MEARPTFDALSESWDRLELSPADIGTVDMIVRRPDIDQREELQEARFNPTDGLEGDNWLTRGSSSTIDGSADPQAQITLINSRAIQLITGDKSRWAESGDQLFVDFDLSRDNLPAGSQIQIGEVIMEISQKPHTGCAKFARRFGAGARKWVMTEAGLAACLRGVNARVIQAGAVKVNDRITKR